METGQSTNPGLLKSQQGPQDKPDGPRGVSLEAAHLLGDIGNLQEIEMGEHAIVEGCQHQRGSSLADLTLLFAQGPIPPPVEPVFDALIGGDMPQRAAPRLAIEGHLDGVFAGWLPH